MDQHEKYMQEALKEAINAYDSDEVPVGAVIVFEGKMIAKAHNQIELLRDATAHAEMIAITQASEFLGRQRLTGCTLYVNLEPCSMCAGAIVLSRIDRLVFGAYDPKAGACGSLMNIVSDGRLNHMAQVFGGVLEAESRDLLINFFQSKRGNNKKVTLEQDITYPN